MHSPLEAFDVIPKSALQRLSEFNIHNTEHLLRDAALPHQRDSLANKTGISTHELTVWAALADLVRIKGIGPSCAELLVTSGSVRNVQEFRALLDVNSKEREEAAPVGADTFRVAAWALRDRLMKSLDGDSVAKRVPSISQLREFLVEAAELRPRIVLADEYEGNDFQKNLWERARKNRRRGFQMLSALVGLLVVTFGLMEYLVFSRLFEKIDKG